MSFIKSAIIALFVTVCSTSVYAQEKDFNRFVYEPTKDYENWCRNGQFPSLSNEYEVGKIKQKTPLIDDGDSKTEGACPSTDTSVCLPKNFIKKDTTVIVANKLRGFYCVSYTNGESSGWVNAADLTIDTPSPHTIADWVGKWSDGTNSIKIKRTSDENLAVTGEAIWLGATLEDGTQVAHTGELDFSGKPEGDKLVSLAQEQYECGAELLLVGSYLIARDNGNCGGMNVSFSSIYAKQKK